MFRSLTSLFFYARFLRRFSVLGYRRAAADWQVLKPDFSGQTWLVTGASGGIGRTVALTANQYGARVLAVARNPDKLEALRQAAVDPTRLIPLAVDLALVRAIRTLPEAAAVTARPIDVLVNNVGVLLDDFSQTEEGIETSFATNLLGHHVLTEGLREAGRLAAKGIVINVSSGGMYGTPLRIPAMLPATPAEYDGLQAYAMHKRAQVALTRHWNRQWNGQPRVHVMHPGWADTEGVRSSLPVFRAALKKVLRNVDQAADTIIWLAVERPKPLEDGGIWFDRQLRTEHEFNFTRKTQRTTAEAAEFLDEIASSI